MECERCAHAFPPHPISSVGLESNGVASTYKSGLQTRIDPFTQYHPKRQFSGLGGTAACDLVQYRK